MASKIHVHCVLRFKHVHKTDILEVRPRRFSNFFDNQNDYSKKLSSVPRQYLCGEYTRKTGFTNAHNFKSLQQKFKLYSCYISASVWGMTVPSNCCSAELFHKFLKDTALLVVYYSCIIVTCTSRKHFWMGYCHALSQNPVTLKSHVCIVCVQDFWTNSGINPYQCTFLTDSFTSSTSNDPN